jgi:hypothetical protein
MALEVTLGNCNVMPGQACIHDFSSANCKWIVKSWIPACAGMTALTDPHCHCEERSDEAIHLSSLVFQKKMDCFPSCVLQK